MQADGLFVITCLFFLFAAWVATGGPARPISQQGPFITPVAQPGQGQQGYRLLAPTNPIDSASYPRQIGSTDPLSTSSQPDAYTRSATTGQPKQDASN